jgi:hypothetical protein
MDTGQFIFQNLYRAIRFLTGVAAQKAVGVPGILGMIKDLEVATAVAPGATTLAAVPTLAMGLHSVHAVVLFNVLRSNKKYGDLRDQLLDIKDAMDKFIKAINKAIDASSPVPDGPPSAEGDVLFNRQKAAKFVQESKDWAAMIRSFVEDLDLLLDDLTRCLNAWNDFLTNFRKFMQVDKPRNIFEALDHATLNEARDWAWYTDETGFSYACNSLRSHRNAYAQLVGLAARGPLPCLTFAN